MLKIYIARHGQDEDNAAGILNGHRNTPLTEKGVAQARETAEKILGLGIRFDAVYSSPLRRAYKTAAIISGTTGSKLLPLADKLLIERNFGIMTGKPVCDIEKLCAPQIIQAEVITYFLNPEGAETFSELLERAKMLLDKIYSLHEDGNILLVTHGDIGKMIYTKYYGLDWKSVLTQFHFGNCDLLLLSEDSPADQAHVFNAVQYNH
jgi:broad specificity phosphatase PhoE